jgi:hypothetical protein
MINMYAQKMCTCWERSIPYGIDGRLHDGELLLVAGYQHTHVVRHLQVGYAPVGER